MKQIIVLIMLLWIPACFSADSDYVVTDKIQLLFYGGDGELDDKQKLIFSPEQVKLSVRMDIEQITQVEVLDVSSDKQTCLSGEKLLSPSTLASFSFNPKANIKNIDFHIKLPCAAHGNKFYVEIKIKSLGEGKYVMKKRFPGVIRTGELI